MPDVENKVKFGLKNVHLALAAIAADGTASYSSPVSIPGAVNLSIDSDATLEKFWADNMAYYTYHSNVGYSGDLEMAYIPANILKTFLGLKEDVNGLLYEDVDAEPPHFALLFQFEGDQKAIRHVLYNCSVSKMALASQTTEGSNEPRTDTISISASPIYVASIGNVIKARCEEGDDDYSTWFTSVSTPAASTT